MTWVKFDDRFTMHRKLRRLSDAAFRLHVSGIAWCSAHLTDGVVREDELHLIADVAKPARAVSELERGGLWETEPGGWRIHDYLDFQPSAVQVRAEQAAKRDRQRRWRRRSRDASRDGPVDASRNASTDASRDGPEDASRDGPDDASRDLTRARARFPSRPVPSREVVTSGGERPVGERADERDDPRPPERPKQTDRPAARCRRHLDATDDPPCRACRGARQAAEDWDRRHRFDDVMTIRRCPHCDADGWRYETGQRVPITPYVRCDHTDDQQTQSPEEARRA